MKRIQHLIVVGACGALVACAAAEQPAAGDHDPINQEASKATAPTAPTALTAQAVVDYFIAAGLPVPNPRDNSKNCKSLGCTQLITTDAISVYSWPNETTAQHQVDVSAGDTFRYGAIVLSYTAARTPEADRPRYEAVLKKIAS